MIVKDYLGNYLPFFYHNNVSAKLTLKGMTNEHGSHCESADCGRKDHHSALYRLRLWMTMRLGEGFLPPRYTAFTHLFLHQIGKQIYKQQL